MIRLLLAALILLASCGGDIAYACSNKGQSCKVDADCCAGLVCNNGCRAGTTVPTTSTSVTTTTQPASSTTTTTVPELLPARFTPAQVGLLYGDSQWIGWDNRTVPATPATQYVQNVRAQTLHWQVLPGVLRAIRDTLGWRPTQSQAVNDVVGKFFVLYSVRPCRAGGPYPHRANYLWDIPQSLGQPARTAWLRQPTRWALHPAMTPAVLGFAGLTRAGDRLVAMPPPSLERRGSIDERPGTVCAKPRRRPALTTHQRERVIATMSVHERQAQAIELWARSGFVDVAAKQQADALGAQVQAAHAALTASARTLDEATLLDLVFTGDIDRLHSPTDVLAHTEALVAWHHRWGDLLLDPAGPDAVLVWDAAMGHAREHFLRAVWLPGLALRSVCAGDIHYCDVTDEARFPE